MVNISGLTFFKGIGLSNNEMVRNEKNVASSPMGKEEVSQQPSLEKDTFVASTKPSKGKVLSKKEQQRLKHNKQLKSETEGIKFKMVKLKFYPEDEAKMENMTVREQIEFIRRLKDEGRYTVVNPEVMDEK